MKNLQALYNEDSNKIVEQAAQEKAVNEDKSFVRFSDDCNVGQG